MVGRRMNTYGISTPRSCFTYKVLCSVHNAPGRRYHWVYFYRRGEWGSEAREWSSWDANPALPDSKAMVFTPYISFKRRQGCLPYNPLSILFASSSLYPEQTCTPEPHPPRNPCSCREGVRAKVQIQCPHSSSIYCVLTEEWGAGQDRDEPDSPLSSGAPNQVGSADVHPPLTTPPGLGPLQPKCHLLKEAFSSPPFEGALYSLSLQSIVICNVALFTRWHFSCYILFCLLSISTPLEVEQSLAYRRHLNICWRKACLHHCVPRPWNRLGF